MFRGEKTIIKINMGRMTFLETLMKSKIKNIIEMHLKMIKQSLLSPKQAREARLRVEFIHQTIFAKNFYLTIQAKVKDSVRDNKEDTKEKEIS